MIQRYKVPTSEHSFLMKKCDEHEGRIDILEMFKIRMGIYVTLAGAVGGLIVSIFSGVIKNILIEVL